MIANSISVTTDLQKGVLLTRMGRLFAQSDKKAHTVAVTVLDGGEAATLTGLSATAYLIRSDDSTVTFSGSISGNVVTVSLPASCYSKVGHFSLIIKVADSNDSTAVFWGDGTITRTTTDSVVDPGHVIPDISELLQQIEAMQTATAAATAAAGAISDMTVEASGLSAGASPTATVTDVSGHKHIAFGIPAGEKGDKGDKGDKGATGSTGATGATGATPNLTIGTVSTLNPGSSATATITGTAEEPVLSLGIPRGADGAGSISTVDGISPVNGNVTLPNMTGATSSAAGAAGKVPAPAAGDEGKYLKGDGTWGTVAAGEQPGNVSVDLTQVSPPSTISVASASDLATLAAKVTAFTTTVSLSAANGDYTRSSSLSSGYTIESSTVGGWTFLNMQGTTSEAVSAGNFTLATIPASTIAVIGVGEFYGVGQSSGTLFQIQVDTAGATPRIRLYLYSNVSSGGYLTGSIAFPYVPPAE